MKFIILTLTPEGKMKHFTIILVVSLLIFQNYSRAQGLNDVCSANGLTVWAVGNDGLVIRSSEGGNYWSRVFVGSNTYNAIAMKSINILIAGNNGDLQRSSNNGSSFSQIPLGISSNLNSIFFFSNTAGWICGDNGKIFATSNAGINWVSQISNTTQDLNQIKFTTLLKGAACGANGTVLLTSDGGNNWTTVTVPTNKELLSIDYFGNAVFSCGVESAFIKSTNNGLNWSSINYNIETKSDINTLVMQNELFYSSAGGGGFIRYSNNGGQTFDFKSNPMFADIKKLFFYNTKGWAVSNSNNAVIRTTDGGNRWIMPAGVSQSFTWELKIPLSFYTSSGNVFAFNPANRNEIFVTGSNKIYRSVNRGDNWTQIGTISDFPINSTSNAFIISPRDTNIFLVAIDSVQSDIGKVFRSTDYGMTWTATFAGNRNADGCPLEMDPNHPDTVYYAPSDSFLYRSTNFGLNWSQVGSKWFNDICIVEVLEGNSNIILTGDATSRGTLYRSSDFGINWNNVNDTLAFEIPDIANSKLNPSYVYCAFFEGVGGLKRSTDRGISWINVNLNYEAWAIDIARDDPTTFAYGTWFDNPIYLTNDGGITFTQTAVIPGGTFALYYYDRATLFAQMSDGFHKMKINYTVPLGINQISSIVPDKFYLSQNYPNPFNPVTHLEFGISKFEFVSLKVYDALGKEVAILVNGKLTPGRYEYEFNGADLPSGIYFYKIETEDFSTSKRMILLK
jgi:photosystem II stability/assembly factor-like uncharacterized protein